MFCIINNEQDSFEASLVYKGHTHIHTYMCRYKYIYCIFMFFLHALFQRVDVLLHWPPHPDLVDNVRRLFRGQTVVENFKQINSISRRLTLITFTFMSGNSTVDTVIYSFAYISFGTGLLLLLLFHLWTVMLLKRAHSALCRYIANDGRPPCWTHQLLLKPLCVPPGEKIKKIYH